MIIFYLILIDITVPILLGYFITSLLAVNYLNSYIIYSSIIVILSFINGFYENYYSKHFSEKLRILFITGSMLIFFQLIYYSYYSINMNIIIIFSWILIPIIILFMRYFLTLRNKSINNSTISIIGDLYKFTDHEIKILTKKQFKVYFYNELSQYLNRTDINFKVSDIAVINMNTPITQDTKLLSSINTISLGEFMENYLRKIYIDERAAFNNINKYNKSDFILKRIIDYTAVLALFPMLIITSIYVIIMKFLSGYEGNFIYTQLRHGKNQNIFSLYKLRTMHIDSDIQGNTIKNDQRIYSFAKVLRKFRLDELPQIINIICGDMHLVGPRAEWVKLSDKYSENNR